MKHLNPFLDPPNQADLKAIWKTLTILIFATFTLAVAFLCYIIADKPLKVLPAEAKESDGSEFCTLSYIDCSVTTSVKAYHPEIITETLEEKIVRRAKEENVNPQTTLRILNCESNLNPLAKNKLSSASGLAQFTSRTWKHYCTGDVFNEDDNLNCFLEVYPKHPDYWECR